jgi:hypothetical protein
MTKLTGASRNYAHSHATSVRNCVKHMTTSWREQFRTAILGELAKLRTATISSVMYVCLSIRKEQLGSNRADFRGKYVEKRQVSLKSERINRHFA